MRTDFGAQFIASVPTEKDANAWKWRLYRKIEGIAADAVIDGYEVAVSERRPYMPSLVDIVDAVKRLNGQRLRDAEHIAIAAAPRVNGLSGYVDHLAAANAGNAVAELHITKIRSILARPPARTAEERNARLDAALAEHERLMETAPKPRRDGLYHHCAVPGCPQPGNFSHSVSAANAKWFCSSHWRQP